MDDDRWTIVLTEPARERMACDRLADAGVRAYVPLITREVRAGRDKKRTVQSALFPGYLFAQPINWSAVRATRGVRDFLRIDGRPAMLPDAAIAAIAAKAAAIEERRQRRLAAQGGCPFVVGQGVTVTIGPFTRLLANVESIDARGRVTVLLEIELLGRSSWPVERTHLVATT